MNRFLVLIITIFVLFSCEKEKTTVEGNYKAFFYMTTWELNLTENNEFIYKSEGHLAFSDSITGKYKTKGDTIILLSEKLDYLKFLKKDYNCIIEIESRFDYCIKWPKIWGSRQQNINYPQLKTSNVKLKKEVEWMLQIALDNKKISERLANINNNLIIQEYFEINKNSNLNLEYNGKPIIFLSEKEIEKREIKEYLIINELSVGLESATVDFQIKPGYGIGTLDFFDKKNGKWIHN